MYTIEECCLAFGETFLGGSILIELCSQRLTLRDGKSCQSLKEDPYSHCRFSCANLYPSQADEACILIRSDPNYTISHLGISCCALKSRLRASEKNLNMSRPQRRGGWGRSPDWTFVAGHDSQSWLSKLPDRFVLLRHSHHEISI